MYEPIFILSCERSGSTLLRFIVETHPDIVCPGHLYLGNLCKSLHDALYFSIGQTLPAADEAERQQAVLAEIRAYVGQLMARYAKAKGKKRWCEKTPMNLEQLELLNQVFPEARYICLYRHALDVAHSCLNDSKYRFLPELVPYAQKSPDNLVAAMLSNWAEKTSRISQFANSLPERCFQVRYEDIVTAPRQTLKALFEFVDEAWEDTLPDRVFNVDHEYGEGDMKALFSKRINADSLGKGVTIPKLYIPENLGRSADALLQSLGYPSLKDYYRLGRDCWRITPDQPQPSAATALNGQGWFYRYVQQVLQRKERQILAGSCRFTVSGEDGGVWIMDLSKPDPLGQGDGDAACAIALSVEALRDIVAGKQNPAVLYEQGHIEVRGDVDLAFAYGQFLFG